VESTKAVARPTTVFAAPAYRGIDRQRLAADSIEAVGQVSGALLMAYLEHTHLLPCLECVQ